MAITLKDAIQLANETNKEAVNALLNKLQDIIEGNEYSDHNGYLVIYTGELKDFIQKERINH